MVWIDIKIVTEFQRATTYLNALNAALKHSAHPSLQPPLLLSVPRNHVLILYFLPDSSPRHALRYYRYRKLFSIAASGKENTVVNQTPAKISSYITGKLVEG